MPENLEIKIRVTRLNELERIAERIGTRIFDGRQVDTYFHIHSGRLKLRETAKRSELIFYRRPDKRSARLCSYLTITVDEPRKVKSALTILLGVKQVVKKHRALYLCRTARIQLDRVQGLGTFFEIEVPTLGRKVQAQHLMRSLLQRFHLQGEPPIPGSYSDLLGNLGNQKKLGQFVRKSPLRPRRPAQPAIQKRLAKRR
ncbi:MAG: class IV adenylate cyclase [Bacteroidota bacterium]